MEDSQLKLFEALVPVSKDGLIPMVYVCKFFKIHYKQQCRNVYDNLEFDGRLIKLSNVHLFGDRRKRSHLTLSGFVQWVLQINTTVIQEDLKPAFIEFKRNIVEYLYENPIRAYTTIQTLNVMKETDPAGYESLNANPDFIKLLDLETQIIRMENN